MKVNAVIDCSTTLLTDNGGLVLSQLCARAHFADRYPTGASPSITPDDLRLENMCNALTALCGLEGKDIPSPLTTRQLYGWLVCFAISRAFGLKIFLSTVAPGDPDPRD